MISDATYTATCDKCGDEMEIVPEVFHRDYSGDNPMICLDDASIEKELGRRDWVVKEVNGEQKHFCCEECADGIEETLETEPEPRITVVDGVGYPNGPRGLPR